MPTIVNGRLPAAMLAPVPWDPSDRLQPTAVAALVNMNADFREEFGHDLMLNEGYRPYETQVAYKQRTKLPKSDPRYLRFAATPGTSVHGLGLAADFSGMSGSGFASPIYRWLARHAATWGFHQPAQYREGGSAPEYWHWEHDGVTTGPAPATPQTQMPMTAEDDDIEEFTMKDAIKDLYVLLLGRLPSAHDLRLWTGVWMANGRKAVYDGIAGSAEARRWKVATLYINRLGRRPESAEVVTRWLDNTGGDFARIDAGIAATQEAKDFAALPAAERAARIAEALEPR